MTQYSISVPHKSSQAFWVSRAASPQNAGLVFDRFVPDLSKEAANKESKKEGLGETIRAFEKKDDKLLAAWNIRWKQMIETAGAKSFEMKTDWRLISGLGHKGMLEVGFTFHRYGFPYLPGSSLKGLARAYGLLEVALQLKEEVIKSVDKNTPLSKLDKVLSLDEEEKFREEINAYKPDANSREMLQAFRLIFGTTSAAGKVIFFDAIPSSKHFIELDIMNPHYPEYYKEGSTEYPTNWQSPIPVQFLTVASDSIFRFAIGWRKSSEDASLKTEEIQKPWSWFKGERTKQEAPPEAPRLQKLARRWLEGGLLDLGAGGKTSAGYGYFLE